MIDSLHNDVYNGVKEEVKNRFLSPVFSTFILSWLFWHMFFLIDVFSISGDMLLSEYGILKSDLLFQKHFCWKDVSSWLLFVAPFVTTWLLVWVLPKILLPSADNVIADLDKGRAMRHVTDEIDVIKKRRELEREKLGLAEEKEKVEEKEKEIVRSKAEEEYKKLRNTKHLEYFKKIIDVHYKNNGYEVLPSSPLKIPINSRIYLDTHGLVNANAEVLPSNSSDGYSYSLTKLGKEVVALIGDEK